jgi:hypothetical protein
LQKAPIVKVTLEIVNQMQAAGVIGKYAIGGAVGATFYLDPAATVDLDIFVELPNPRGGTLISLEPVYRFLKSRGGTELDEYIVIGGWPVQVLPPSNPLEEEAIREAVATEADSVPTWVMRAEYLVAIALSVGRAKDHARVLKFLEQKVVDREKLEAVLERHNLTSKWKEFERKYGGAHE